MRNLLYIQGGGPTSVINRTAQGVLEEGHDKFEHIFGAHHGLEGVLHEDMYDMKPMSLREINTPSSAFGTSRMELRGKSDKVMNRIFDVLAEHKIMHVITNGGEDTAENALILYREAHKRGKLLHVAHAPKTIDNDLPGNHHCPGFGTAARYIALTAIGNYLDAKACKHVKIDVTMGRTTGWLTASALLARDSGITGPHLIYVPEHDANINDILSGIEQAYRKHGFAHAVISEGYGEKFVTKDSKELASDFALETFLKGMMEKNITKKVRIDKYGYAQRSTLLVDSHTDTLHAYLVGRNAVKYVLEHDTPIMICIGDDVEDTKAYPSHLVNHITPGFKRRTSLWAEFLGTPGIINDSFLRYARPLTGIIPAVKELPALFIKQKLPPYEGLN